MRYLNLKIAAAVAVAIAGHTVAEAGPSVALCATPGAALYVAGSSAAQPAFVTTLATDLFDSTGETIISATHGDFKAYCGVSKVGNTAGIAPSTVVTVYYRGEGGSVVGALPLVGAGKPIKFLDISQFSCQTTAPVVAGTSTSAGTVDGWTGCVTNHLVEMGITDLEPTVFVPPNYPSTYRAAVFGTATKAQLASLASTLLFQQVFGIYVNTAGINGGSTGQPINLSRETVTNILNGNYTDWSFVPSASGGPVSTTSQPITVVNREAGSGTRTSASIYFLGTNCVNLPQSINDPTPANDGYATGDVLVTVARTPGAITYASIDNGNAALSLASLSGVKPSNLAAATGQYDWWFEATAQKGPSITSPNGIALYNFLTGFELEEVATAPHAAEILAIPNIAQNLPLVPPTANTVNGVPIYINPFTKGGDSCSIPVETN